MTLRTELVTPVAVSKPVAATVRRPSLSPAGTDTLAAGWRAGDRGPCDPVQHDRAVE